jgi:hypothetical protein
MVKSSTVALKVSNIRRRSYGLLLMNKNGELKTVDPATVIKKYKHDDVAVNMILSRTMRTNAVERKAIQDFLKYHKDAKHRYSYVKATSKLSSHAFNTLSGTMLVNNTDEKMLSLAILETTVENILITNKNESRLRSVFYLINANRNPSHITLENKKIEPRMKLLGMNYNDFVNQYKVNATNLKKFIKKNYKLKNDKLANSIFKGSYSSGHKLKSTSASMSRTKFVPMSSSLSMSESMSEFDVGSKKSVRLFSSIRNL